MSIIKTAALSDDHIKIGISRGTPRFQIAPGWRLYRKLQPGPWFNSVPAGEFIARYQAEILAPLGPQQVLADLQRIGGDRIPVLCCFERPNAGVWCHRAMVASWLAESLGIAVPEFGFETAEHPLRPPPVLI